MSESFPKSGKQSKMKGKPRLQNSYKLASMDDKIPGAAPAGTRGHLVNNYGKTPKVRGRGGVAGDTGNIYRTVSYNGDKFGTTK